MSGWTVGPAVLSNGSEAFIYFVQPERDDYRYIGRAKFDGVFAPMGWSANGEWVYGSANHDFNLKPQEDAVATEASP